VKATFLILAWAAIIICAQTRLQLSQLTVPNVDGIYAVRVINGKAEWSTINSSNQNTIYDVTPTRQSNGTLLLPQTPINGVVVLHVNGIYQRRGTDYTVSGAVLTCVSASCLSANTNFIVASYAF